MRNLIIALLFFCASAASAAKQVKLLDYKVRADKRYVLRASPSAIRKAFPYMVIDKLTKESAYIEVNNLKPADCKKEIENLKKNKIKAKLTKSRKDNLAYCEITYKDSKQKFYVVQRMYFKKKAKHGLSVTMTSRVGNKKRMQAMMEAISIK